MPQRRPAEAPAPQPQGAMSLGQAADQIGGLNLFGDPGEPGEPAPPKGGKRKRQPAPDDVADDDNADDIVEDDDAGATDDDGETQDDGDGATDDDDGETQDDGEDKGEPATDDEDDQNTGDIKSLSDLAAALEVEPEFLDTLELSFRADGEDVTVNIGELRAGYQRDANYRRQTQELAETRRTKEAEYAQKDQHYVAQLTQLGQVLQQGEQLLVGQINTAEMQRLRTENPAEWAAQREELQQRINGVRQLYSYAAQQYDAYMERTTKEAREQLAHLRETEMANLQSALPDWNDQTREQLTGYLGKSFGFTPDDLKNVFDSRLIVLANKARLFDEMQEVGKKTRKKVVQLPKVQKPGKGAKTPATRGQANLRKARQQLAKTGKVKDAAALIGLQLKDI